MIARLVFLAALMLAAPASAEIVSVYTDLDAESDCTTYAAADEGDGDWADLACTGYRGYPVLLFYGDAREIAFYGFPPEGERPGVVGFSPFNSAGPKIEWRVAREPGIETLFAAIHHWFVAVGGEGAPDVEILIVSKVAQIDDREGCIVGYVTATGNANANGEARTIADESARDFDCAADEPVFGDPKIRDLVSQ